MMPVVADSEYYIQQLINAISLGGLFALLTLGWRWCSTSSTHQLRVWRTGGARRLLMYVTLNGDVPPIVVIPTTVLVVAIGAILMERVAFRPFRGQG